MSSALSRSTSDPSCLCRARYRVGVTDPVRHFCPVTAVSRPFSSRPHTIHRTPVRMWYLPGEIEAFKGLVPHASPSPRDGAVDDHPVDLPPRRHRITNQVGDVG